ncbi:hypothetical protein [Yinghuangia soli]|uniref:CBS domain-containing protein n=1 Tax=Yinghuangia soli TaxID=2908204 RepID=A0AA41Q4P0_9ACTN|nr:hypothetical protein [Yinghuangia soli]MCF2531488.1 hypothetical protein [Yinghuangia soli]
MSWAGLSRTSGPRVSVDMTVEVALSVMFSALSDHLFLCDEDDQRTGVVTRAQLAAIRDSPSYTDRVRLQDVIDTNDALAGHEMAAFGAEPVV